MAKGKSEPGQAHDPSEIVLIGILVVAAGVGVFWLSVAAGDFIDGRAVVNPIEMIGQLARGQRTVSPVSWVLFGLFIVAAIAGLVAVLRRVRGGKREDMSASMGNSGDLASLSKKHAKNVARRVRGDFHRRDDPGLLIGETNDSAARPLYADWEAMMLLMAGSTMGKTTSYAVPAIMEAPGAVMCTTNKPDLYRDTAGGQLPNGRWVGRAARGRIWLFDPQMINSDGQPTFWWNPLKLVRTISDAARVAEFLVDGCDQISQSQAGQNAYFEGGAKKLLSMLILAAAQRDGDLYHVKEWLAESKTYTPVRILQSGDGYRSAEDLATAMELNARQKDGLWDMARSILAVLNNSAYGLSVTPPRRTIIQVTGDSTLGPVEHRLPEFSVVDFAESTDTLYALSKNEPGSAASLLTLLIGQVTWCAIEIGSMKPSGRLDPPMVGVLDEAANICPLTQLPNWYSFYRSYGIILLTVLQSPSQGENVWGPAPFKALIDAATINIYGGNIQDDNYITALSGRIGPHWIRTGSRSHNFGHGGGGSTSSSWQKDTIMEKGEVSAIRPSEAIIEAPGVRPVFARKIPHMTRGYAAQVRECAQVYAAHLPGPRQLTAERPTAVQPAQPTTSKWGEWSL
jgi:type IV secretory pathway TraG/TraD family ATPase VirD4